MAITDDFENVQIQDAIKLLSLLPYEMRERIVGEYYSPILLQYLAKIPIFSEQPADQPPAFDENYADPRNLDPAPDFDENYVDPRNLEPAPAFDENYADPRNLEPAPAFDENYADPRNLDPAPAFDENYVDPRNLEPAQAFDENYVDPNDLGTAPAFEENYEDARNQAASLEAAVEQDPVEFLQTKISSTFLPGKVPKFDSAEYEFPLINIGDHLKQGWHNILLHTHNRGEFSNEVIAKLKIIFEQLCKVQHLAIGLVKSDPQRMDEVTRLEHRIVNHFVKYDQENNPSIVDQNVFGLSADEIKKIIKEELNKTKNNISVPTKPFQNSAVFSTSEDTLEKIQSPSFLKKAG